MSSLSVPAAASASASASVQSPADSPLAEIIADSRKMARHLIDKYFKTNEYPYTRHHIQSFDQFIKKDMPAIIQSNNPVLLLKDLIKHQTYQNQYKYKVEIFIGGPDGQSINVGTPTVSLQNTEEVRLLFPNEARLRNLTYATTVYVDIFIKVTYTTIENNMPLSKVILEETTPNYPLFKIPIMLHSSLCTLNGKSAAFLQQAGECPQDHGGYFIIDGSEKILITRQEQAFNTLYTSIQKNDPIVNVYATIQCLSPQTRQVKRVSFALMRDKKRFATDSIKSKISANGELMVSIPFVRKPLPVFLLFRALGVQTDEDIFNIIFPDRNGAEYKLLAPMLIPSAANAAPFFNKHTAIQYIKTLTKGFGEEHVLDILYNQFFIHIDDKPRSRAIFLGDCVRAILRCAAGIDTPTDKDDTRNQRCLTSGFLTQMLFAGVYKNWIRLINRTVGEEYKYNQSNYQDERFKNIFLSTNTDRIFSYGFISDGLSRGFKGRWGEGLGEEKSGVLQALSRMSYLDFMSHCRRVVSSFDTSLKLTGPRHLHPSQFGYFCTNETPGGASIGVAKNLSILTYISTGSDPAPFVNWLRRRMNIRNCADVNNTERVSMVPIYVNAGIVGFTSSALRLTRLLKLMKRTGWLPPTTSITFNIRNKQIAVYMDEGRPVRPLIILNNVAGGGGAGAAAAANRTVQQARVPYKRLLTLPDWRHLILGNHPAREQIDLTTSKFEDPLADIDNVTMQMYEDDLVKHVAPIEYVDPYEQNESFIANFPDQIVPETTHIEIHPSTILSVINSQIPFANHNQSPRNQLGCAQSKQALSLYATNWQNRYDNNAHILCYGETQLTRTIYQEYFGEGKLAYGQNIVLALCCYTGYNQEDGIVMNRDAIDRGLFRSIAYRSYEAREEDDDIAFVKTRIGNPASIAAWMDLKPGLDYSKLDDRGIVRVGEYVDEMTVIVGAYLLSDRGDIKDASLTPQVWTKGRVEDVVVTVSNTGMRTVKIRISQDRKPELGDKFCLTPDHEVLTDGGWKSIADVSQTDKVASLTDKGDVDFVIPTGFYAFACDGEDMYKLSSQQVDLCTTMKHKMYVKTRNAEKHELIEADKIIGKRVQYMKNALNKNIDYHFKLDHNDHHSAHNPTLNMDAFLEFLGFWVSDGWVSKQQSELRVELCIGKKSEMDRAVELIKQMGYNCYTDKAYQKVFISNQTLARYLEQFSKGAANKQLPDWVWNLSTKQSQLLVKGLIGGDGTVSKKGVETFFTTSNILADQFQRLCLQSGWSANKYKAGSAGTQIVICGKQTQLNSDFWRLTINKHKNIPMINHGHTKTQNGQSEEIIKYTGSVYCIEVPSHIFYVRLNGKPVWTGNSNRHGQKGTIGMLVRGHDMPRTGNGLVPDLLVNPHSIPSRMTMGQLMEQIMGKVGALVGSQVDGTAFMNEGTPAVAAGAQLEELGFEKYGNEILYNGVTGQQILSEIFIAPIYGMRLKHMVEDKWQARDKGRREQRTHQPTGGRGAQGGLKIGEQERDAIIAHGAAGFQRESFMVRSDGEVFPVCTGCGTIPIYNKRLNIAICTLCDGPIQFSGSTPSNLEIIPPNTKQTAEITHIEIPYATKLLEQELNVYLNMGMRFVTTKAVQKLQTPITELDETGVAPGAQDTVLEVREFEEIAIPDLAAPMDTVKLEEVQEAARTLGMALVPNATASAEAVAALQDQGQGGPPNILTEDVEAAAAAVEAAQAAVEGGVEESPVEADAAGVPNDSVSESMAIKQAATPVAQGEEGEQVIAIDTSAAALQRDGIAVEDQRLANGELPPPGSAMPAMAGEPRTQGGRRTLGSRNRGPMQLQGAPASSLAGVRVTVQKME